MAQTTEPHDLAAARRARSAALSDTARELRALAARLEAEADAILDTELLDELAAGDILGPAE